MIKIDGIMKVGIAKTLPKITTFTIRAGVGNAVSKLAWAACVFFPGFFVVLQTFTRHFWAVATTACEWFSTSSPAVMLAIGSRTGTQGWFANCIIFTLAPSWSACFRYDVFVGEKEDNTIHEHRGRGTGTTYSNNCRQ